MDLGSAALYSAAFNGTQKIAPIATDVFYRLRGKGTDKVSDRLRSMYEDFR